MWLGHEHDKLLQQVLIVQTHDSNVSLQATLIILEVVPSELFISDIGPGHRLICM